MEMIARLRADAAKLLSDGRVRLVIGYADRGNGRRAPVFVADPAQVDRLVFDDACRQNLAAYLRKVEIRTRAPVAVVASPAVMRSLVLLATESQIAEGAVLVLAAGPGEYFGARSLAETAALLTEKFADLAPSAETVRRLKELAAMSADERAAFWSAAFAKCTRCYACRAACPGCYCTRCVVERNMPQWISTGAAEHGNYAWNIIRAFHLAGRCTGCGACEEACPQGLPLGLLNAMLEVEVAERFGVKAGYDLAAEPVIGSFAADDNEDFIK